MAAKTAVQPVAQPIIAGHQRLKIECIDPVDMTPENLLKALRRSLKCTWDKGDCFFGIGRCRTLTVAAEWTTTMEDMADLELVLSKKRDEVVRGYLVSIGDILPEA